MSKRKVQINCGNNQGVTTEILRMKNTHPELKERNTKNTLEEDINTIGQKYYAEECNTRNIKFNYYFGVISDKAVSSQ